MGLRPIVRSVRKPSGAWRSIRAWWNLLLPPHRERSKPGAEGSLGIVDKLSTFGALMTPSGIQPSGSGEDSPRRAVLREARPWILLSTVLLLLGVLFQQIVATEQDATMAREHERLQTLAQVVAENLGQQLLGIDSALTTIRADAPSMLASNQDQQVADRLRAMSDAMPGVRTMLVLDVRGKVRAASRAELTGLDLSDRPYFKRAQAQPSRDVLFVSEPFKTALGVWSITLVKAWPDEKGALGGMVTATLDPVHFDVLLRSVLYGPGVRSAVVHGNGQVFVQKPPGTSTVDLDLAREGALFDRHRHSAALESLLVGKAAALEADQMVAFRDARPPQLHLDQALVVSLSRPVAAVLVSWRRLATVYAVMYVVVALMTLLAVGIYQRNRSNLLDLRRTRELESREQAQRLKLALEGGDLGLWDLDVVTGVRMVNARAQEMVGLTGQDRAEDIAQWGARVHPDDHHAWVEARQSVDTDGSETLTRDYRVRHQDGRWIWIHSRGKVTQRGADGQALRISGTYQDDTERKATAALVERATQLLERMSRVSGTGGWDHDLQTGRSTWSAEMFRIRELDPAVELDSGTVMNAYAPESRARLIAARLAAVDHQTPWDMELELTTATGKAIWVRSQGEAVVQGGKTVALTGTLKNVTWRKQSQIDLKDANEKLERMALTDGLTGIANRRLFDQTLQAEWSRSARNSAPLSLLMIDIDHFKLYNDHYGHAGGDQCLQHVAALLATCSRRASDLVSRFGGEEFAVLLPGTDLASARIVAQACVDAVAGASIVHATSSVGPWVTVSVGVACMESHVGNAPIALIERADAALYRAKRSGRGRLETFMEAAAIQQA